MLAALWKDLERTWASASQGAAPASARASSCAEDVVMLDASRPLRALLRDYEIPQDVVPLFEANISRLADAALKDVNRRR